MSRLLRWFVYFIVFLVLLVAVAYGAAHFMKPKILETITEELKRNVNGEVHVGNLDFTIFEQFPVLSITLSEIHLRGPKADKYHREFFSAGKIFVHANLYRVLQGEINLKSITVRNADIFIFRTAKGYTNLDVFKKPDSSSVQGRGGMMSLAVERILLEDSRFTYFDSAKRKSYGATFIRSAMQIGQTDTSRLITIRGPMRFAGMMFNEANGSYLKNKEVEAELNLEFVPKYHRLVIAPSILNFHESMVKTSGYFNFREPGTFVLDVQSEALSYAEGLTIVTPALAGKLEKYRFDKPIELSARIEGVITRAAKPKVDINFSTKNNHGVSGDIDITRLAFVGSFTNHVSNRRRYDDENSRIDATSFSGVLHDIPFNASFNIENLSNPVIEIVSRVNINLADLNKEVDLKKFKFSRGALASTVEYKGKLSEDLPGTLASGGGTLSGTIDVKNGFLEYVPSDMTFRNTDMRVKFNERDMIVEEMVTSVNGNTVDMKGTVSGLVPYLYQPKEKGSIRMFLHARRLDLATLTKKAPAKKKAQQAGGTKRISEFIDAMYAKAIFDIDFKVDELVNGPLRANGVAGKVRLANNQLSAEPFSMKLAGGSIDIKVKMSNLDKRVNPVACWIRIRNADIKKLFIAFGNFSQKNITAQHISGKVTAVLNLTGRVDDRFKVLSPSVRGVVDVRIKNGRIKDYPPLQNMSNFLFKKRDFTDVQFAEIRSHFQMEGKTFNIQRMEIESTVLKLFIEGRYSATGDTDLSIQVPLSNLKKRDKDYKPQNIGVDAKVGPSVFLRAHQKDGNLVLAYDPLKKFRKK